MYKATVTYTDFNDEVNTTDLYFNISKARLAKNLHLRDEVEALQQNLAGEPRELTADEVREILNLVENLIRLAYGVRSVDGKTFNQSEDVLNEFQMSAAYDQFLFSLFEQPEKAVEFMLGVMPKDLVKEAKAELDQLQLPTEPQLPPSPPEIHPPTPSPHPADLSDAQLLEELRKRQAK